jgi:hypothetical protein
MPSKFSGKKKRLAPVAREPNGRAQRLPADERRSGTRSVVLNQPHRKGDDPKRPDPGRYMPIGRLIGDRRIRAPGLTPIGMRDAVEEYQRIHGNFRRALDSRRPLAVTGSGGGPDLTRSQADRYEDEYNAVRRVLRDAGLLIERAVVHVLEDAQPSDDERAYAPWVLWGLGQGLAALMVHFGWARQKRA